MVCSTCKQTGHNKKTCPQRLEQAVVEPAVVRIRIRPAVVEPEPQPAVEPDPMTGDCSICLEPLNNGREVNILGCQHHFHNGCLHQHLVSSWGEGRMGCPNCRIKVRRLPELGVGGPVQVITPFVQPAQPRQRAPRQRAPRRPRIGLRPLPRWGSIPDDTEIRFVQNNPKRPNTSACIRFEVYKVATTVGQLKNEFAVEFDLYYGWRHDYARGFVDFVDSDNNGRWL